MRDVRTGHGLIQVVALEPRDHMHVVVPDLLASHGFVVLSHANAGAFVTLRVPTMSSALVAAPQPKHSPITDAKSRHSNQPRNCPRSLTQTHVSPDRELAAYPHAATR
jgi:hypothetical protein